MKGFTYFGGLGRSVNSLPAASRRRFLRKLGLASAGLGAGAAFSGRGRAQTVTDVDIVQFALNLEYLEAEFYSVATTGMTLAEHDVEFDGDGTPGETTGGQQVTFIEGSTLELSAQQIAADERAHVALLREALTGLGVTPIAKPTIDLDALETGFESQEAFLSLARVFEDLGMSAYAGAAPLIESAEILGTAARILASEALHTANLRLHTALYRAESAALDDIDVEPPPGGEKFFTTDENGLVPIRTPGQVLFVVYGNAANAPSGGFFPDGLNGNIKMSEAGATPSGTTS